MKVCLVWKHLEIFDRYVPQMKAIADNVDSFYVTYFWGNPKDEWKRYFEFEKLNLKGYRNRYYRYVRSLISTKWFKNLPMYKQLINIDPDVFYCLSGMQEPAYYFSKATAIPYVVRLRGNYFKVRNAMNVMWWKKEINNYLDTKFLVEANLVIPISTNLKEEALLWGVPSDKISTVIGLGVDTDLFKPVNVNIEDEFVVGYAGRVSPEKGGARLISIAKQLPEIRFIVAGKNQMPEVFPPKLKNLSYLGELTLDKMPWFYNNCDLIILPSYTEGFPNVVIEAYACQKPVLATPESFPLGDLDIFGEVAPFDRWVESLMRLKKDGSRLKHLGENARRYVKKYFTWESFGKKIVNHLRSVVRGEPSGKKKV